jgi:hypothetical protein
MDQKQGSNSAFGDRPHPWCLGKYRRCKFRTSKGAARTGPQQPGDQPIPRRTKLRPGAFLADAGVVLGAVRPTRKCNTLPQPPPACRSHHMDPLPALLVPALPCCLLRLSLPRRRYIYSYSYSLRTAPSLLTFRRSVTLAVALARAPAVALAVSLIVFLMALPAALLAP